MNSTSTRNKRGQSIIETVVGILFLVPIVLFLFDVAVLVLSSTANDNLAKSCCRAAASAVAVGQTTGDATSGSNAAIAIANGFAQSNIIKHATGPSFLTGFSYNADGSSISSGAFGTAVPAPPPGAGQVACSTTMLVILPVPFPFVLPPTQAFVAKAVEPIVSITPP